MVSEAPAASPPRYEALDALRGICATAVAFFHFAGVSSGEHWAFTRHAWLFVDFFFVLSGLVIASSYGERLARGFSPGRFMALRLGRIYPLHLAVLLAMVAVECLAMVLSAKGILHREAFAGSTSLAALAGSLGMVHIFGIWPDLVWNGPSWSIADEIWAYLVFALVCRWAGGRFVAVMATLALGCALWIALGGEPWLERTFWGSLPRCLYGFGLGVAAWRLLSVRSAKGPGFAAATLIELAVVAGCIAFVSLGTGPASLLAPPLFLIAVLVFAGEAGAISRLLTTPPLRWLGRLSYSIYMIHAFLLARIGDVLGMAQHRLGLTLMAPCETLPGFDCFVLTGAQEWALRGGFLAALLAGSWLAWRLVEEPGRRWSRRRVGIA